MLGKKMEAALNEQINKEMYSAYLYMAMSARASQLGFKGAAKWLMVQYHEEMLHAMKLYEYVVDQNATVHLTAIAEPSTEYPTLLDLFTKVLGHEQAVTAMINGLMDLAIKESDHATQALLAWYVTEQVEEEKNAGEILQTLSMIGDNRSALFLYDKELGVRTVMVPTDFSAGVAAAMKQA